MDRVLPCQPSVGHGPALRPRSLDSRAGPAVPYSHGNHPSRRDRRRGRRRAARAGLSVRPRLPRAGRLPAPARRRMSRRPNSGCRSRSMVVESTASPARLVHPGPRRCARPRRRPRPRLGVGARPDAADGLFLHAAGFHCLTFDVRGNGANPAEALPLSAGEFGADTLAAFRALIARPRGDRRRPSRATRWAASARSSRPPPTRASRPSSRRRARPTRIG